MPAEGEAEPVEVITVGDYYQKNGKHYVLYEEVNEGFDLLIEDIAVTDRSFQISMGGQMLFKYENEIAEIGFSEIAGAGRNKRKAKVKL